MLAISTWAIVGLVILGLFVLFHILFTIMGMILHWSMQRDKKENPKKWLLIAMNGSEHRLDDAFTFACQHGWSDDPRRALRNLLERARGYIDSRILSQDHAFTEDELMIMHLMQKCCEQYFSFYMELIHVPRDSSLANEFLLTPASQFYDRMLEAISDHDLGQLLQTIERSSPLPVV